MDCEEAAWCRREMHLEETEYWWDIHCKEAASWALVGYAP